MTQDEIIRMAREAGFHIENWSFGERVSVYESGKTIDITNELKDFAALVAAHERNRHAWTQEHWTQYEHAIAAAEREAMIAEAEKKGWAMLDEDPFEDAVREIADIRARSNHG